MLNSHLREVYNRNVQSVSRDVMQRIRDYSWPGNVRELENALERSLLFAPGDQLTVLDLARSDRVEARQDQASDWKVLREQVLARAERQYLENSLKNCQGDVKKVAENMGISTRAVYHKIKKHHLQLPHFR